MQQEKTSIPTRLCCFSPSPQEVELRVSLYLRIIGTFSETSTYLSLQIALDYRGASGSELAAFCDDDY